MSALNEYRQLMVSLFKARREHAPTEAEDAILDAMDPVWYRMNAAEREVANVLSGRIASGELSEEQFIAMHESQNDASHLVTFSRTSSEEVRMSENDTSATNLTPQPPKSPLLQTITTSVSGIPKTPTSYSFGSQPLLGRLQIQEFTLARQDTVR